VQFRLLLLMSPSLLACFLPCFAPLLVVVAAVERDRVRERERDKVCVRERDKVCVREREKEKKKKDFLCFSCPNNAYETFKRLASFGISVQRICRFLPGLSCSHFVLLLDLFGLVNVLFSSRFDLVSLEWPFIRFVARGTHFSSLRTRFFPSIPRVCSNFYCPGKVPRLFWLPFSSVAFIFGSFLALLRGYA